MKEEVPNSMATAAAPVPTDGGAVAPGDDSGNADVDVGLGFNFHRDIMTVICENW